MSTALGYKDLPDKSIRVGLIMLPSSATAIRSGNMTRDCKACTEFRERFNELRRRETPRGDVPEPDYYVTPDGQLLLHAEEYP